MGFGPRLLKISEVAALLGLSVGTIYHLVSQRRLPCIRLSARCLRFSEDELGRWIEEKQARASRYRAPIEDRDTKWKIHKD